MSAVSAQRREPAGARLVVVGRDPRTALGRTLDRVAVAAAEAEPSIASGPADGRDLVIGAAAPDPAGLAARAASNGWRVLLEPLGAVGATGLADLQGDPPGVILPALRRRHEPDARWARAAVGRGAIGLPWGAHAEALASRAPDPLTEALDLADALERVASIALQAAVRLDRASRTSRHAGRAPGKTLLASLAFEHGVVGQAAVRAAPASSTDDGGSPSAPELVGLRVTGSHGTVLAELDAPLVELPGSEGPAVQRLGPGGADRLLAAFLGLPGGDPGDLASIADAARLCAIIEGPPRKGGQR